MPPRPDSQASAPGDAAFDISRSSFFQFLEQERAEIRRHREIESSRIGQEIDIHAALHSWFHRKRWEWQDRLQSGSYED